MRPLHIRRGVAAAPASAPARATERRNRCAGIGRRHDRGPWHRLRCACGSAVLAIAADSSSLLLAHSWYPPACCTGQDCRKVDRIDHLPDGGLLMHFGGQQVVVPRGFEQLPSQDADAHVCVYRNALGRWVPRCVFIPAGA